MYASIPIQMIRIKNNQGISSFRDCTIELCNIAVFSCRRYWRVETVQRSQQPVLSRLMASCSGLLMTLQLPP